MTYTISSDETPILYLDASHDQLLHVRLRLLRLGFSGGYFEPRWPHNGRHFQWGMYLGATNGRQVTPGDQERIETVVQQTLADGVAIPAPAPAPSAPSPSLTIGEWQRELTQALDQFRIGETVERQTTPDPQLIGAAIDRGEIRRAGRLLDQFRVHGVPESALAPYALHYLVRQQHWEDAVAYYDAQVTFLGDRLDRARAAEALLHAGDYGRSRAILDVDPPVAIIDATQARWIELSARVLWALGERVAALIQIYRLLNDEFSDLYPDERGRWRALYDLWAGEVRAEIESMTPGPARHTLLDTFLPYAPIVMREELLGLQGSRVVATYAETAYVHVREMLDAGSYADALAALERIPLGAIQENPTAHDALRADALFSIGRYDEAESIDARLVADEGVDERVRGRALARLIQSAAANEEWDLVAARADHATERDVSMLDEPAVRRAVALAWAHRGEHTAARPALRRALEHDAADVAVAEELWGMADDLSETEKEQVLRTLVRHSPRDVSWAMALTDLLIEREAYADTYGVLRTYLQAMAGYQPDERTCKAAEIALLCAEEAVQQGVLPIDERVAVASRFVGIHVQAGQSRPLVEGYLAECLALCPDAGDQLSILEQAETATDVDLRRLVISLCTQIFVAQRQMRYPPHLHTATLLLDSLSPDELRMLVPDEEERARYETDANLDLSAARICLVGGTTATRARALAFLAARYGLPRDRQREIEPFEGRFSESRLRDALLTGQRPTVDVVVHVPDCESHAVFYALRSILDGVRQRGTDLPIREAAGAGQSSIIRAVEDFYRERSADGSGSPAS